MRIRSIKPDFWRSEDVTELCIEDRLLFVGLWSYVDDNGVGKDSEPAIIGDLFAADMFKDPRETVARVSRGLSNLAEAGRIARYSTEKGDCIYVVNWERHQRIDKPNKPRLELPSPELQASGGDSRDSRESVASSQRIPAPGAGEQGNRGAGENPSSSEPADAGTDQESDAPDPNDRDDVRRIYDHLTTRLRENEAKTPDKPTKAWLDAARLLINRDQRPEQEIHAVIDWCQQDSFWKGNILSLPKLREKYDQLRLKAKEQHERPQGTSQHQTASERRLQAGAERLQRRAQTQAPSLDNSLLSITEGKVLG